MLWKINFEFKTRRNRINNAAAFGSKLGLENIRKLLELLGNPQDNLKIVHVAGTNGKGSVCSYIANILVTAGYRTGLFTSPYLEKFTERMQVDFNNIPDDKLIEYVGILQEKITIMTDGGFNHPTFFELNTAITLMYFNETQCDAVVLETGLGGRFDSTNIIKNPVLSVITTIGYDHVSILGDTLGKIAFEKAGIIKPGCPVALYGDNDNEAVSVIKEKALESVSKIYISDFSKIKNIEIFEFGYSFDYKKLKGLKTGMLGIHQIKNACLAVDAADIISNNGLPVTENDIRQGLLNTSWPGRIEIISKNPLIICDATHNPQGAEALKRTINERFEGKNIVYVMGVMKDKNYEEMAKIVLKDAYGAVTVTPKWHRA
ncbi:MAG: bifunctional folylpolyglutamate synthase/dihydrofolate synthase, partial [Clostridiales bacterium]|nr:bifunctional folylpolyglutamate synthase/dihydrofolate synthase [Clostridiales bacterium]